MKHIQLIVHSYVFLFCLSFSLLKKNESSVMICIIWENE